VYTNAKPWRGARKRDTRFERRATGQQGGASDNPVAMRFRDTAIDALRPAKVIRIYDQIPQT
jgi:hypothetical protein